MIWATIAKHLGNHSQSSWQPLPFIGVTIANHLGIHCHRSGHPLPYIMGQPMLAIWTPTLPFIWDTIAIRATMPCIWENKGHTSRQPLSIIWATCHCLGQPLPYNCTTTAIQRGNHLPYIQGASAIYLGNNCRHYLCNDCLELGHHCHSSEQLLPVKRTMSKVTSYQGNHCNRSWQPRPFIWAFIAVHLGHHCNLGNNAMHLGNKGHTSRQPLSIIWKTNACHLGITVIHLGNHICQSSGQPLSFIWASIAIHLGNYCQFNIRATIAIDLGNHGHLSGQSLPYTWATIAIDRATIAIIKATIANDRSGQMNQSKMGFYIPMLCRWLMDDRAGTCRSLTPLLCVFIQERQAFLKKGK